jgi:glycosyltransferase involved in cell wall biosynthesis
MGGEMETTTTTPRVTIGMPVYNGENFIAETLDSLLAQTFTDFELIISDNASTDSTALICQEYAARDSRIRYDRLDKNVGASGNFNRLVDMARGEYFKWSAHDDIVYPAFLERCVDALDRDPGIIGSYTGAQAIDGSGRVLIDYDVKLRLDSRDPKKRYYDSINVHHPKITMVPVIIFGLIRTEVLKQTQCIGNYASSDGVLLGELSLQGRWYEVPETLFCYRHHAQQSWIAYNRYQLEAWYDPNRAGKITFPHWRLLKEHLLVVKQAPINPYDRLWCYGYIGRWIVDNWRGLLRNVMFAGRRSKMRVVTQ